MTQLSQSSGIPKSNHCYCSKRRINKSKPNNSQPISKHVMALITFLALLPLVYFIPDLVGQFLPDIKWLNVTVAVGFIVPIISYIVIPTARLVLIRELNSRGNTRHSTTP